MKINCGGRRFETFLKALVKVQNRLRTTICAKTYFRHQKKTTFSRDTSPLLEDWVYQNTSKRYSGHTSGIPGGPFSMKLTLRE